MTHSKIRVAVLEGGPSCEHEVSLVSAASVMQNIDRNRFTVVPIRIERNGVWRFREGPPRLPALLFDAVRAFDVVFPVVHGTGGEDGTLQGLLEQAGVPYVGCGVLASAMAMDKDVSKRLAAAGHIPVVPFVVIKQHAFFESQQKVIENITSQLHFPMFVKPANTGSSVGIEKVTNASGLISAVSKAFLFDAKVLVEQGIDAVELEVAVLESPEGGEPIASVVGEIRPRPRHSFYSYAAKYLDDEGAELIVPAEVNADISAHVQALAKDIFIRLECEGMARIDFFQERGSGKIFFNELNTIPGFTSISMYPRLMAASGISYAELLSRLIDLALKRYRLRQERLLDYPEGRSLTERQAT